MKPTVLAVMFMVVFAHQVSADERLKALSQASCDFAQRLHFKLSFSTIESVDLEVVNAMLVNSDKPIEQQFKSDAESKYLAKIETFKPSEQDAEKKINDYVSQKTYGEIREIIKKGSINDQTSVVLVSTLSFNATWQNEFDVSKTSKQPFTWENGKKEEVEMMNDTRIVLYKRDNQSEIDVIQMPFKGGRFAIYFALPRRVGQLAALEERLSEPGKSKELLEGLQPTTVELAIPKFKIEKRFELKQSLREMGMEKAFEANSADFKRLHISEVVHAAVFEIEERGTRGSSASVTEIESKSRPSVEEAQETFIADHGFMFWVLDNSSSQVVFQGSFNGQKK
ncbi:unnamed protein product [Candidula unifasciata]|uniref:Serpin domain-containing protein n=1 Tax=Candidula unifasciata TaxID=100452 RepID=A0A8S4A5C4_9EUPU|nr:unnamed protein product [Candidula unifasciata]